MRVNRLTFIPPFLLGIILLFFPLLRDFHFESAFLASIIGAFWAVFSLAKSRSQSDIKRTLEIIRSVFLIGIPPLIYTIFSGCFTWQGLGFWILLPLPSVFFGAAVGRFAKLYKFKYPSVIAVLMLIWVSVGGWMVEFYTLPQVYFFNHVWGNWPGPIYDETLSISKSLVFFRVITSLWVGVLWMVPSVKKNRFKKGLVALFMILLTVCYFNLTEFNVITPRKVLKQKLALNIKTDHFDLYFDANNFDEHEANYWALKHEFYFDEIINQLEIDWPTNRVIESYLYSNAWQKKQLVGAKFTSYVPIWLSQDQLHIAKQQLEGVLQHELVHVISKQFGNALFNGSYSIGAIEGVAEAIAKDASPQSTLHQIIAAEQPYPSAEQMKSALTVSGFYSSASSISYTTAGSFVQFLLDNYEVQNFKNAYPNTDFESNYGKSFEELVQEWHNTLAATAIDSVDKNISEFFFSRQSLFQKKCPHKTDNEFRLWDEYNLALSNNDTTNAIKAIDDLYGLTEENSLVKREWIQQHLMNANYSVADDILPSDTLLTLQLLKSDALFLAGNFDDANEILQLIKPDIESSKARNFKYYYQLRSDTLNWHYFVSSRYKNEFPLNGKFKLLSNPVQLLILSKSIELETFQNFISELDEVFAVNNLSNDWFDIYEQILDRLVYHQEYEKATLYLNRLSQIPLRQRYNERLQEVFKWNDFVKSYNQK